jgi:hypothetical protein
LAAWSSGMARDCKVLLLSACRHDQDEFGKYGMVYGGLHHLLSIYFYVKIITFSFFFYVLFDQNLDFFR